jgi:hypothetical protein
MSVTCSSCLAVACTTPRVFVHGSKILRWLPRAVAQEISRPVATSDVGAVRTGRSYLLSEITLITRYYAVMESNVMGIVRLCSNCVWWRSSWSVRSLPLPQTKGEAEAKALDVLWRGSSARRRLATAALIS